MRKVACSFFPEEGVVRDMGIRAGNVGVLDAAICSAVPAGGWLHFNAGLPCQDDSKANRRRDPARLREHIATFFIAVQRLRAKCREVTWSTENVVCAEFIGINNATEGQLLSVCGRGTRQRGGGCCALVGVGFLPDGRRWAVRNYLSPPAHQRERARNGAGGRMSNGKKYKK